MTQTGTSLAHDTLNRNLKKNWSRTSMVHLAKLRWSEHSIDKIGMSRMSTFWIFGKPYILRHCEPTSQMLSQTSLDSNFCLWSFFSSLISVFTSNVSFRNLLLIVQNAQHFTNVIGIVRFSKRWCFYW